MEAPAGLAAVSLRLHGGEHCRPPISRMGNKAGYGAVILAALGLRSGQGASRYLWAEADDDVAALLRCYPDSDMLRRVAAIIRGWADEEPRALWERLRAERKARGPRIDAEGTAAWMFDTANAHGGTGGWKVVPASRPNTEANLSPDGLADRLEDMALDVAGTVIEHRWSFSEKGPTFGYGGPGCEVRTEKAQWTTADRDAALGCERTAERVADMHAGWPPVAVTARIPEPGEVAEWLGTPGDLEGCAVYMDPPYVGTTGYRHNLGRDEVVRLAIAYAAMGATVAISEAEALPELVAAGWHVAEISAGRKGQKRTFSKQQGEFVTMNQEPAHRVAVQAGLFASGAA